MNVTDVPATKPVRRGERRRWYVHLALLLAVAGSLVTLIYLSHSITIHVIFGVTFMVFVLFHLFQRRRTVVSLTKQIVVTAHRSKGPSCLAISDTILELLVLNVLLSGVVDIVNHQATQLNFLGSLGFPPGLIQWHKLASLILVVYVVVHVSRRWARLRHSHIR
jgi:uncharacterized protein YebE (UPF0316 family)